MVRQWPVAEETQHRSTHHRGDVGHCPGREWLSVVVHRLADSSVSESVGRSSPLPADGVVFDGLHSSAAELCVVHLAIDVLSARMASNDAVSMAEEKHHRQTATGRHGGNEHGQSYSSCEIDGTSRAHVDALSE